MSFEVNIQYLVIPGGDPTGAWWAWWPKNPDALLFKGKEYVCIVSGAVDFQQAPDDLLIKWFTEKKPDIAAKQPRYNVLRSVGSTDKLR